MNPSFIHADIFFYITSVAVVILTALLIILFYYLVKIARHMEHAARRLKEEGEHIMEDVSAVRESFEEQGGRIVSVLRFVFGSFLRSKILLHRNSKANKKDVKNVRVKSRKEESGK